LEFRVGVGVRGQESVHRSQELEFRVGVGVGRQESVRRRQELEFRVGVGVRGQESVHRRQELEFRVGVGERWWRSFMNFFNAETRNRPLRVGATRGEATEPSGARAERRRVAERDF
jgi:hypothetical protein